MISVISRDTWVLIVKYAASIAAVAYGIYATVNDFHEEKGEKKVLSRAGYLGIVFLVFSGLLGICSDLFKDSQERIQSEKEDIKRQQLLDGEIKISNTVANQLAVSGTISTKVDSSVAALHDQMNETQAVMQTARRALTPLPQNLLLTVAVEVPSTQPTLQSYVNLLNSSPPTYPNKGPEIYIDTVLHREFIPKLSGSLGEQNLASLFLNSYFNVALLETIPRYWSYVDERAKAELQFESNCEESDVEANHPHPPGPFRPEFSEMVYQPQSHLLVVSCHNLPAVESNRKGTLSSLLDLGGKYLVVRIGQWSTLPAAGKVGNLLSASDLQFNLKSVQITASFATRLTVQGFQRRIVTVRYPNESRQELIFVARIPETSEWD